MLVSFSSSSNLSSHLSLATYVTFIPLSNLYYYTNIILLIANAGTACDFLTMALLSVAFTRGKPLPEDMTLLRSRSRTRTRSNLHHSKRK